MQHFKNKFSDPQILGTLTNIQKCLRLNDLQEVGDGTHYLTFEMIGFFSFREWSVPKTIDFFFTFLERLNIKVDYVTIHPDKIEEWRPFYSSYSVEIRPDESCKWSDGSIGGYCTEFYKDNIEIGNIVNPLGTCIDVGFGLERLLQVSGSKEYLSKLKILEQTCEDLISSGVVLGNNKQSYILKKLITECVLEGSENKHPFFNQIRDRQLVNYSNYLKNKDKIKYKDKDPLFWLDTFGVDINKIDLYSRLKK